MRWTLRRRLEIAAPLLLAVLSRPTSAQGWIVPRPCGFGIMPVEAAGVAPPIRDCRPNISRTRSDVRVELADRVLRYEVEERFVNRGGDDRRGRLSVSASGERRVSGSETLDQRRARLRRDDERRRGAPHLRERSFARSAIRRSSSGWDTGCCARESFRSIPAKKSASSFASRASRRAKATRCASTTSAARARGRDQRARRRHDARSR